MTTYTITVYDQAGEFGQAEAPTIRAAAAMAKTMKERYPRKVVQVANLDNVDLGCSDGLTDDERAELEGMGL